MVGLPLRPEQHLDGVSLVPVLKGGTIANRPLFWHYPHYGNQGGEPSSIMRSNEWKLIYYHEDGRRELYNVLTDPEEQKDVANDERNRVNEMFERLVAWLQETDARFPFQNPNFSEKLYAAEKEQTRMRILPNLERDHAAVLIPDWQPRDGWWENKAQRN